MEVKSCHFPLGYVVSCLKGKDDFWEPVIAQLSRWQKQSEKPGRGVNIVSFKGVRAPGSLENVGQCPCHGGCRKECAVILVASLWVSLSLLTCLQDCPCSRVSLAQALVVVSGTRMSAGSPQT